MLNPMLAGMLDDKKGFCKGSKETLLVDVDFIIHSNSIQKASASLHRYRYLLSVLGVRACSCPEIACWLHVSVSLSSSFTLNWKGQVRQCFLIILCTWWVRQSASYSQNNDCLEISTIGPWQNSQNYVKKKIEGQSNNTELRTALT